jgi:hypothetical protein
MERDLHTPGAWSFGVSAQDGAGLSTIWPAHDGEVAAGATFISAFLTSADTHLRAIDPSLARPTGG